MQMLQYMAQGVRELFDEQENKLWPVQCTDLALRPFQTALSTTRLNLYLWNLRIVNGRGYRDIISKYGEKNKGPEYMLLNSQGGLFFL